MTSSIKIVGTCLLIGIVSLTVFYAGLTIWGNWHDEWSGYNASAYISDGYCNIAVVPILGDITSYGEYADENVVQGLTLHTTLHTKPCTLNYPTKNEPYN